MREIRSTDSYVNYHYFICIEKADAYIKKAPAFLSCNEESLLTCAQAPQCPAATWQTLLP